MFSKRFVTSVSMCSIELVWPANGETNLFKITLARDSYTHIHEWTNVLCVHIEYI